MRFLNDPEWGQELAKARKGVWSERLIEIINERLLLVCQTLTLDNVDIHSYLIDKVVSLPDPSKPDTMKQTVFATPSNANKQAINHIFTKAMSTSLPNNMLPIRVVADFWGQLDKLSNKDKAYIMGLDESKFGRLAPFLDLIIGMPVMVTQNAEPRKGIANGTFGILEDIQFPQDTLFRKVYDNVIEVEVLVPSKLPTLAWIRTNRGEGAVAPPVNGENSLQNRTDLFPIYPCKPFRSGPAIKLVSHDSVIKNLKITQLPIIPCSASTAYKLQGETLESEVIVDWKSEQGIINKRQQAYLMLSRCTTRNALITLNKFTDYLVKWFVPEQDVLEEDDRLKRLSEKLIIEMNEEEDNYFNSLNLETRKEKQIEPSKRNSTDNSYLENKQLSENYDNNDNNKHKINIISGSMDYNLAPVNYEVGHVEQLLNIDVINLLSERKQILTVEEKVIVQTLLNIDQENQDDIIIQR